MEEPCIFGPTWRLECTREELEKQIDILDKYSDYLLDLRSVLIEQLKRTDNTDDHADVKEQIEDIKTNLGTYLSHVQILKNLRSKK